MKIVLGCMEESAHHNKLGSCAKHILAIQPVHGCSLSENAFSSAQPYYAPAHQQCENCVMPASCHCQASCLQCCMMITGTTIILNNALSSEFASPCACLGDQAGTMPSQ